MAYRSDNAPLRDNPTAYGVVSRANHWIIAAAMIGMLVSGLFMAYGPMSPQDLAQIRDWHKAIGDVVLAYGLWRIGWRVARGFPKSASSMPRWQETASNLVHWGLLGTVLAMPLSGILTSVYNGRAVNSFGLVIPAQDKVEWIATAAGMVHQYAAWALVGLLLLHIVAALKHHFIDRDTTLRRMIRGSA